LYFFTRKSFFYVHNNLSKNVLPDYYFFSHSYTFIHTSTLSRLFFANNSLPFNNLSKQHFYYCIIFFYYYSNKKKKKTNPLQQLYEKPTSLLTSPSSKPNKESEGKLEPLKKGHTHTYAHVYEAVYSLNQYILTLNRWKETLHEIIEINEAGHCQL
jgi:hypothetical protein